MLILFLLSGCGLSPSSPTPTPAPISPLLTPRPVIVTPSPLPPSLIDAAGAEDLLLINLYDRVNPGVVNIDVAVGSGEEVNPFGSGSGFLIDAEGHIVTNLHVVAQMDVIWVTFSDGTVQEAQALGTDPFSDLAVLRAEGLPPSATPLEMGDSDLLQVGQRIIAIGNPFGRVGTMTTGIVSGLDRTIFSHGATGGRFSIPEVIQTDAAINPGNSGGPLLNTDGEVVGVNTAIQTDGGSNSGVGFAIPSNVVARIIPYLMEGQEYPYPYLGITWDSRFTMAELALELNLPADRGVLVASLVPGGPADEASVLGGDHEVRVRGMDVAIGGDIITAVDGTPISDFHDLIAYLVREKKADETATLTLLRDGEFIELDVELGERPR
jgi:2-alkenal reductase